MDRDIAVAWPDQLPAVPKRAHLPATGRDQQPGKVHIGDVM
jgi:hypothetical protein